MSWDPSNAAHACLWVFVTWDHNRRRESFENAGQWTTTFVIRGAQSSAEMNSSKARRYADKLDNAFRSVFGATYAADSTSANAREEMAAVLRDSEKTLSDLGKPVSDHYSFTVED